MRGGGASLSESGFTGLAGFTGFRFRAAARLCQNQGLQDWRDLQDFAFGRIARLCQNQD